MTKTISKNVERKDISVIFRSADVSPSTINEEKRTVEVVFSTGARVLRVPFFSDPFYEELSLDPKHVRLDRLNAGGPVLNNHSSMSLSDVIGVVDKASADGKRGIATLRFSNREDVKPIWEDVKNGILRNVSVGYRVHKFEKIKPKQDDEPYTYRAVDWEPYEISMVGMPADPSAQVRATEEKFQCEIVSDEVREVEPNPEKEKNAPEENGAATINDKDELRGVTTVDEKEKIAKEQEAIKAEATKAERSRCSDIRKAVKGAGLAESVAEKMIEDNTSADDARKFVIDELSKRSEASRVENQNSTVTIGATDLDKTREGIANALSHRLNHKEVVNGEKKLIALSDNGRRFRGRRLLDWARSFLEASGERTVMMSDETVMKRVFHSTSEFTKILADAMNKSLRDAYEESARTWEPFVRETEVNDFKTIHRTQLSAAPGLDVLPEHSEIKSGSISDAEETYSVVSYAKMLGVSRQAILNDDLSAFDRMAPMLAAAAARTLSDKVYNILVSNPNMGDGIALFNASHSNLGSAGAISITTLTEARKLMRKQVGLNSEVLNLIPQWLIVPPDIEVVAQQFLSSTLIPSQASNVNPFADSMGLIVEPRLSLLSGGSATAWFMSADKSQIDLIEVAYLSGRRQPEVLDHEPFDMLGVQFRCVFDFGQKAIDYRGFVKNAG